MFDLDNIEFANPEMLYLLFVIPVMIAWYIYQINRSSPLVRHSNVQRFELDKFNIVELKGSYSILFQSINTDYKLKLSKLENLSHLLQRSFFFLLGFIPNNLFAILNLQPSKGT